MKRKMLKVTILEKGQFFGETALLTTVNNLTVVGLTGTHDSSHIPFHILFDLISFLFVGLPN